VRVAFIHPFLFRFPRGIERFVIELANALVRRGIDVLILTWRWPKTVQIGTLDPRVEVYAAPTSRYYAVTLMVPFYVWHLLNHTYDFIWVFFAGFGEARAITLVSRFRRLKYGVILHYPLAEVPHRYKELKLSGFDKRAQKLVSVSRFVADGVQQFFGRDTLIIPSAVDANHFAPNNSLRVQHRADLGLDAEDRALLTIAALDERKGIQNVLDALPAVLSSHPRTKYFVVGEGAYRSAIESQIRRLGLSDNVILVGPTHDVIPYYNAADIFVLLSHGEASPLAPLEAMAMKLPVITANQRPFDEMIGLEHGVLVDEREPKQVAHAIKTLLSNSALCLAMGEAGRRHVLANYTWERISECYLQAMR
jgi:glycosyltransferase involved in cell wall biosynthesis